MIRGGIENFLEALVDELRHLQRMEDRVVDAYRDAPQTAAGLRVSKQIIRQQGVQIQNV